MDPVRAQYEAYPYPARDPAEETARLITGSPSHPVEIDHFLFSGRRDWSAPFRALVAGGGTGDGLIMLTLGWIGFLGHICLVYALGQAPASALAPYNYAGFVWALLLGLMVFSELPDGLTFLGAAIILGAGIYVWHRERIRAAEADTPPAAPDRS